MRAATTSEGTKVTVGLDLGDEQEPAGLTSEGPERWGRPGGRH